MNPYHTVGGKRHSLVGEETCVESEREGVARCALCATGRGLTASFYLQLNRYSLKNMITPLHKQEKGHTRVHRKLLLKNLMTT